MLRTYTISFLILLISSINLYAQSVDTATIHKLLRNGKKHQLSLPDSAIYFGEKALKLSTQQDYKQGVITSNNLIGMSYWVKGDFNKGLNTMQQTIKYAKEYNDTSELATAYGNTAILYIDMGDRDLGLEYSKKAIRLYRSIGEEKNTVNYTNNIGWIYEAKEMYDSALYYYQKAYAGYKKYFDSSSWLGQTLTNISSLYYKKGMPKEALDYAQQALNANAYITNQKVLGHCYLNMSKALLLNNRYKESISYAEKTLDIAQSKNINTLSAETHWLLYKNYEQLGDYKQALVHLDKNQKWRDSLVNEETDIELSKVKTQLATEIKDKELVISEQSRQRNLFYFIISVIVAIAAISIAYLLHKRNKLSIAAKNEQLKSEQKEKQLVALALKNEELQNETLKKELLSFTITTAHKNQMLQDINEELAATNGDPNVRKAKNIINTAIDSEEDWEAFKIRFEQVHNQFFKQLKNDYPKLTANDLRLAAFIKLNLNAKQVASLLNIAPSSVDISKYRLKKKLGLTKEDNLHDVINSY